MRKGIEVNVSKLGAFAVINSGYVFYSPTFMKRQISRFAIAMFCALFSLTFCTAQITDSELWSSVGIEKNFKKKFRFSFEQGFRFDQTITHLKSSLSEISFLYKVHDFLRLSTGYRISIRDFEVTHRVSGSVTLRYRKKPWTYSYRAKFQTDMEVNDVADHALRNKVTITHRINKRFSPYAGGEVFYHVYYKQNKFEKFRLFGGLQYSKKDNELKVFYLYQREFNIAFPEQDHIFGLGYGYRL
jgi:hypothetical protein